MGTARLADVRLPQWSRAAEAPQLPSGVYPARVDRLRERATARRYDRLVVYADREHSANLAYLTGFDPRFEEAILILGMSGTPALLAGNECIGLARAAPEIIDRRLGDPFFGIFLNPGHQLHLDEWVNSPVSHGSRIELRAGMVMQVDIIPNTGGPYFTTNIEDGIALADSTLRQALERSYPDLWDRVTARRAFMRDALGIDLHADVLPLSNLPAFLPPFLLRPDQAMTLVG